MMQTNIFGETEKPSVEVERTKLEGIYRFIKVRCRNKEDLIEFARLINRPDLERLDGTNTKITISWSKEGISSLEGFFE